MGWDVYKNGTWIDFISDKPFCLDGISVVCANYGQAMVFARRRAELEELAEKSFNAQHPELNP